MTVMFVMNAICDNIKSIADTKSTDVEVNAKANDNLTIQGLYMSIFGIISSIILLVALYLYFVNKMKLINFNAIVPSGSADGVPASVAA
jgi:phosphotransferase system  glucose/maltose/N-acetylglucosamine-specific IIC component